MGAMTGAAALFIGILPSYFQNPYVYGVIFLLLGFSEAGVLLGRKTYLIDKVEPAFANTVMGMVTLLFGFMGILAQVSGIRTLIVVLILLGIAGAIVSFFLPEASGAQVT